MPQAFVRSEADDHAQADHVQVFEAGTLVLAQLISRVFRKSFRSIGARVPAASALTARLSRPGAPRHAPAPTAPCGPRELAAILFTSGSTGAPKGVRYEHGMFEAQVAAIREAYTIAPGEIDLPLLPIFALFNPALGMTTIVPEIDPRRPARQDAKQIMPGRARRKRIGCGVDLRQHALRRFAMIIDRRRFTAR